MYLIVYYHNITENLKPCMISNSTFTVLVLIKRKIQFSQGNSKIAVVISITHQIFRRAKAKYYAHVHFLCKYVISN